MKRFENLHQIQMLTLMGTVVHWTNSAYVVTSTRGVFNIVHENGYCESLVDDQGELKDKAHEFYCNDIFVHGIQIQSPQDVNAVLDKINASIADTKLLKMEAIRGSHSLQDKIKATRAYNSVIRERQNDYDYVYLNFWQLIDIIE